LEQNVVYLNPPEPTLRDKLRAAIELRRDADDRARADELMCEAAHAVEALKDQRDAAIKAGDQGRRTRQGKTRLSAPR